MNNFISRLVLQQCKLHCGDELSTRFCVKVNCVSCEPLGFTRGIVLRQKNLIAPQGHFSALTLAKKAIAD